MLGQNPACENRLFDDGELEGQLLAATDHAEIELPELSRESQLRPALVDVDQQLQTEGAPDIRQRDISANGFQPNVRVEGKELAVFDKAVERVAVEMIAMCRVSGPVGI